MSSVFGLFRIGLHIRTYSLNSYINTFMYYINHTSQRFYKMNQWKWNIIIDLRSIIGLRFVYVPLPCVQSCLAIS